MKQFIMISLLAMGALVKGKDYVAYPYIGNPFNTLLESSTVYAPHTFQQWPAGQVPFSCARELSNGGCASGHIQVYNVTYTDCERPWVFCRCDNAHMPIGQMADRFGRMPVHLRSMVRHPMALGFNGNGCAGAWAFDNDIVLTGDCPIPTWIHEAAHHLDARGDMTGLGFSNQAAFSNAWTADTCAVSNYGNTNPINEEFAELSIAVQYNVITGSLPAVTAPASTGCFNSQLQAVKNAFGANYFTYGGTCRYRVADSPPQAGKWALSGKFAAGRHICPGH